MSRIKSLALFLVVDFEFHYYDGLEICTWVWLLYHVHQDHPRGRGIDKRTFSRIPFHTQKIRGSRAGPRDLLVKTLQSEAENVPFKANVWDWTGMDVSGGRCLVLGASVSLSGRTWLSLHLLLRLQDEEINKCQELGEALQPGWERSSYSSHPGFLQITAIFPLPQLGGRRCL